jgi:hypothetical protein
MFSTKFKIISGLGAFVLILMYITTLLWLKANRIQQEKEQVIAFHNSDSIGHSKTKDGGETVTTPIVPLTPQDIKKLMEDERLEFIKQFTAVNKKLNNLESVSTTTAKIVTGFKLNKIDTFIPLKSDTALEMYEYQDEFNYIKLVKDSLTLNINVPIHRVDYWQRRRKFLGIRFGQKVWTSEVYSPNTKVVVTEHSVVRAKKR